MAPPPAGASSSSLRPTKAAYRYRKGQAPKGYAQDGSQGSGSDSEGSSNEDTRDVDPQAKKRAQLEAQYRRDGLQVINQGGTAVAPLGKPKQTMKVQVKTDPDQIAAEAAARVKEESSSEEESSEEEETAAPAKPTYRPPGAGVKKEESDEESSSEEESSEEEVAPKPLYKPVFVSKRNRDTQAKTATVEPINDEEAELKRQAELEQRRKQSTYLAGEAIQRELAEKATEETFPDVDDTDGLDGEAEFEGWKLRELMRLKRERETYTVREAERAEVEARRAMPQALRLKEDLEYAKGTRAEKAAQKAAGGGPAFLQKYHHKGAFYADDEILQRYDYSVATEGSVRDVSSLPKAMQKRNYGKMSQSKYTHLVDQDTSDKMAGWGASRTGLGRRGEGAYLPPSVGGGGGHQSGCFQCGGDHMKKDCPELREGANAGPSGANASALRPRRMSRSRSPPPSHSGRRDRESTGRGRYEDDAYRRRDRSRSRTPPPRRRRSRSRTRSRSPPRGERRRYRDDRDDPSDKRRRRD